jgi:hypothetical protein
MIGNLSMTFMPGERKKRGVIKGATLPFSFFYDFVKKISER